jgi:hypothetical protein
MIPALATTLVLAGTAVLGTGVWRQRHRLALPWSDPRHGFGLLCATRAVLVGGASIVAGTGLLAGATTVVGLAAVIGGEELLETSVAIAALRADLVRRNLAGPFTRR